MDSEILKMAPEYFDAFIWFGGKSIAQFLANTFHADYAIKYLFRHSPQTVKEASV